MGGDGYTTAHTQIDAHTFLIAKGKSGCLGLVDTRVGHTSTVKDYKVFDRVSPKCVDAHPVQKTVFLAANNKGGCFVFDARQQGKKSLMEPLCELVGHEKSISTAVFSPLTGNKVVTMCWDNQMRLFQTSSLTGRLQGKKTFHNNNTGRWLTPFKAHWRPGRDDLLLTGSMGRPREIEAWSAQSDALRRIHQFRGEELGSVCSVAAFHPSLDIVVGGNSSGRLHVFM